MTAIVFTNAPRKAQKMGFLSGAGSRELEFRPIAELKKALPSLEVAPLVYLDMEGLAEKERARLETEALAAGAAGFLNKNNTSAASLEKAGHPPKLTAEFLAQR